MKTLNNPVRPELVEGYSLSNIKGNGCLSPNGWELFRVSL
jgi:hypothetical protein